MSHVAVISTVFKDLECLEQAAKDCGLVFNWNQKTWKYYGSWVNDYHDADAAYKNGIKTEDYGKCLHAISVPGNKHAYEIGIVKNPNAEEGGYKLLVDFYGGGNGLQAHIGGSKDYYKLQDAYSKHVVIKQAEAQGYTWEEETAEDGATVLKLYDYA